MAYKIAVVGFGLAGRLAALELVDSHDLTVFERTDEQSLQSAGRVAAAMLAPMAESVLCEQDLALLGLESISRWQSILSKLDGEVFFQQQGSLVIAHQQDKESLHSFAARVKPLNEHRVQLLDNERIKTIEPELSTQFNQGLYLPCEGQIDNQAFYRASLETLKRKGVEFKFNQQLDDITEQLMHEFDYIIDCRGLGAQAHLHTDIKHSPLKSAPYSQQKGSLRGVRGEVARIYAPEVKLTRPVRLMHPRYPIYIAPKPNNQYVIGATEIESQDSGPATVRSALELLSAAFSVHSGFAEARLLSIQTGLRPAFNNNRPFIAKNGKVISINGLYRHGYMLGPALVAQALSHIEEEQ